ncbi:cytochrome P450 [Mycobacterium vicinigordonae]|uniref:Cytochrome P450 n=1 Tax=Mycobacterium vicinigordonae TaxID=1719132 RepID=A0A7D6EA49_9MYCO|nr:cytochrome P450 [Mycobacterium vicinigordonae]
MLPRFDPHDQDLDRSPHVIYARYRRHDPVHWGRPFKVGGAGCWYLFRHEHVVSMLKDRRFRRNSVSNGRPAAVDGFAALSDRLLLSLDPPDHGRLRSLVAHAFAPSAVQSLRVVAVETADRLLEKLQAAHCFDVIDDYAAPLSMSVIAALVGLAPDDVDPRLAVWISQFGGGFDLRKDTAVMEDASTAAISMLGYFDNVVATHARSRPGLLNVLITARDTGLLKHEELLSLCVQIVFAGYGTTVAQIGNIVADLWTHPEQRAVLQAHPEMLSGAVNESLRLHGSVQSAAARKPVEDVMLGGVRIAAGQPVIAFVGSANRDELVFERPDEFDITRDTRAAVTFGAGMHYCLGARLARLKCEVAVDALLRRLPHLALAERRPPNRNTNIVLPSLGHLMVVTAA